jgi:hypothetical protein
MPAWLIPALMTGASALAGLMGGRKKTTTETAEGNENTSAQTYRNIDMLNMPEYDPMVWKDLLTTLGMLKERATTGADLRGYAATGVQNINAASALKRKALDNILASRGLFRSPIAGSATTGLETDRISQVANFLNGIPLLQRQMQGEDLDRLGNFINSIKVGSRQTGSEYTLGNQQTSSYKKATGTDPGNMLAGLFSGAGAGLASIYGMQMRNKNGMNPGYNGFDTSGNGPRP